MKQQSTSPTAIGLKSSSPFFLTRAVRGAPDSQGEILASMRPDRDTHSRHSCAEGAVVPETASNKCLLAILDIRPKERSSKSPRLQLKKCREGLGCHLTTVEVDERGA